MYRPIIGGAQCIVAHPTKILGGRPTLLRPNATHGVDRERCKLPQQGPWRSPIQPQSHLAVLYARKTHLVAAFLVLWSALQ